MLAKPKPCYSDPVIVEMLVTCCFCLEVPVFCYPVCSGTLLTQNGYIMQGRKTAAQVQRLEALHAKQQAVLRRKTEEAEAARKRLHVTFQLSCPMARWSLLLSQHRYPVAECCWGCSAWDDCALLNSYHASTLF